VIKVVMALRRREFIDLERSSLFLTEEQVMFDSGG
jgi:hypothetical protein